jgi:hypothetical protein
MDGFSSLLLLALVAYQGKDIVFRFIHYRVS